MLKFFNTEWPIKPERHHCIPLSIITVCFNEAARIALTCESVVNQIFQNFEWIVIDGGSTDGTLDILKKYAQRMTYFVSEPDRGIYHAMNKGIAQAQGMYLLFLNGGDYLYEPETLARVFVSERALEKDVYQGEILFERQNDWKRVSIDFTEPYTKLIFRTPPHQAMFIQRVLFDRYGLYDESFSIAADLEFILRVFISSPDRKQHTIEHLPFIVSVYESTRGLSVQNIAQSQFEKTKARQKHYPTYYFRYYHGKKWLLRHKPQCLNRSRLKNLMKTCWSRICSLLILGQ